MLSRHKSSGTVILLSGSVILFLTLGLRASYGLFIAPLSEGLGWGRDVLTLSLAIQNLVWGVTQPVSSMIAERYGAGRVLFVALTLHAVGLFAGAWGFTPSLSHLGTGFLVGTGLGGASFSVILAVIGRSVADDKRSLALGIATAAASLGQFLIVPVGAFLIERHGWQNALVLLGLLVLAAAPLSIALRGTSEQPSAQPEKMGATLRRAAQHSGFLLLSAGFFICGFQFAFITVHLPSSAIDAGMSPQVGAWTLALAGLANIFGAYLFGVLGTHHRIKYLLSGIYLARSLLIFIFIISPPTVEGFLIFGFVIGILLLSTVPLTASLIAQIFGPRYMGTLYSFVFLAHQLGGFIGVWLGGVLYETTGSYDLIWWICIDLGLLAVALHWPIADQPLAAQQNTRPAR